MKEFSNVHSIDVDAGEAHVSVLFSETEETAIRCEPPGAYVIGYDDLNGAVTIAPNAASHPNVTDGVRQISIRLGKAVALLTNVLLTATKRGSIALVGAEFSAINVNNLTLQAEGKVYMNGVAITERLAVRHYDTPQVTGQVVLHSNAELTVNGVPTQNPALVPNLEIIRDNPSR